MLTYQEFIEECKKKDPYPYQKHHIIPRCIGGEDTDDNIIKLSYEDHWMAHQLLHKENPDNVSLRQAVCYMGSLDKFLERCKRIALQKGENNPYYGKKHTDEIRKKISEKVSGEGNGMYGTHRSGELNPMWGKHHSEETIEKIRQKNIGRKESEETRYKKHLATSGKNNPMYGKEHPNKGKKMYNNGVVQVLALECPEGFVLGRLRKAV